MEHLQHFGLTQDPFSNEPDLRFYFESTSHRDAQRRVERGLRQRKGLTLLTGDGGMGKTLLARRILESLEEEVFEATLLVMLPGAADATGILQRFARQLGTDEPAADRAGLLGQIYEQLAIVREDGRHAVLMVDDAQIMTPEVFAELGGLVNLEYEDRRLVSILFVGSLELDRLVENDSSIAPRVDIRVRLQPLDMTNASNYLRHRLSSVKGNAAIVPASAIDALYKFGRGRPRLLNTLADNALFEAYLAGRDAIDPGDVERAASDLGIGPDPGSTYSQLAMAAPVPPPPPTQAPDPSAGQGGGLTDDSLAGMDLMPDTASASEFESDLPAAATVDLDAGLEAALEDLGNAASAVAVAAEPSWSLETDALDLDSGPIDLVQVEADAAVEALDILEFADSDELLAEAELTPLEAGDADVLEDVFVELLEE